MALLSSRSRLNAETPEIVTNLAQRRESLEIILIFDPARPSLQKQQKISMRGFVASA